MNLIIDSNYEKARMKIFLFAVLLLLSLSCRSQVENKFYLGGSLGTKDYHFLRAELEQHLLDGKYILGLGYATDLDEHFLQLKLGFRLFRIKEPRLRMYVYLPPYLNLNLTKGKYNTPFAFEIIKDFTFWKSVELSGSIHTDIFTDYAVPQLKLRMQIFSWKGKK